MLVCLGISKYKNIFVWELAVNFNEHSHAGNKIDKVMPDAHGNLTLIIFESIRELGYKKKKISILLCNKIRRNWQKNYEEY